MTTRRPIITLARPLAASSEQMLSPAPTPQIKAECKPPTQPKPEAAQAGEILGAAVTRPRPQSVKGKPHREHRGPVSAHSSLVTSANAIRALLTIEPGVLPQAPGDPVKPLKIGIRADLAAYLVEGATPEKLSKALRRYVRHTGYHLACSRNDAMRHDLDGQPVEEVEPDARINALKNYHLSKDNRAAQKPSGQGSEGASPAYFTGPE